VSVQHQPALMMALRTGSVEVGSRCADDEGLLLARAKCAWSLVMSRHGFERMTALFVLSVDISDAALAAACDGTRGDVNCAEWENWLTRESARWPRP